LPLSPPPRDDTGAVVPHDHQGILPDDGIIRRISEEQIIFDDKINGRRISSKALKASSGKNGGMSVDLQRQIEEAGLDAKVYVTTPRWTGSLRFLTSDLRNEGFQVGCDPIDYENPYHGEVWGEFTKVKQNRLRNICAWFVEIAGVSI
jgi:hypothetical protein